MLQELGMFYLVVGAPLISTIEVTIESRVTSASRRRIPAINRLSNDCSRGVSKDTFLSLIGKTQPRKSIRVIAMGRVVKQAGSQASGQANTARPIADDFFFLLLSEALRSRCSRIRRLISMKLGRLECFADEMIRRTGWNGG